MKETEFIPDWMLERYMLAELSADEMRRIRDAAIASSALAGRIGALERENGDFLARHPSLASLPARKETRTPVATAARRTRRLRRIWPALVPAMAAMFAVIILNQPTEDMSLPETDGIRVKGGDDALLVYQEAGPGKARQLEDGNTVSEHDRIQLGFRSASGVHAAIISVDGRGAVTLHWPEAQDDPTGVNKGQLRLLAKSYILDDAPQFERFYLFISENPISTGKIIAELKSLARDVDRIRNLRAIPGLALKQLSLLLRKADP